MGMGVNMALNGVYSDSLKKQYDKLQNLYKSTTLNSTLSSSQLSTNQVGQGVLTSQFQFHKPLNSGEKVKK